MLKDETHFYFCKQVVYYLEILMKEIIRVFVYLSDKHNLKG